MFNVGTHDMNNTLQCLHFLEENSPGGCHIPVLDDGVVEVPVEGLLDVRHILHLGNTSDRDLLPPFLVSSFGTHPAPGTEQL